MLTNSAQLKAIVTGASNQIGYFLLPQLVATGFEQVIAYSRQPFGAKSVVHWQQADLCTTPLILEKPSVLFHLAPLTLLPPLLIHLLHPNNSLKRIIAFSSTSRLTKINSADSTEQTIATQLANAEETVMSYCQHRAIPCTLLRPTMIYGCGWDKNISFIARFIRRFGFFPFLVNNAGLRQPVHAEDLAIACLQVYACSSTFYQIYNLSGGQTLSYREMVETIFYRLNKKPRFFPIPMGIFCWLLHFLRWLPNYAHLSTAMIQRLHEDLCFDHTVATQDFGYSPRRFTESDLGFEQEHSW